jgi:hypothetical protein
MYIVSNNTYIFIPLLESIGGLIYSFPYLQRSVLSSWNIHFYLSGHERFDGSDWSDRWR